MAEALRGLVAAGAEKRLPAVGSARCTRPVPCSSSSSSPESCRTPVAESFRFLPVPQPLGEVAPAPRGPRCWLGRSSRWLVPGSPGGASLVIAPASCRQRCENGAKPGGGRRAARGGQAGEGCQGTPARFPGPWACLGWRSWLCLASRSAGQRRRSAAGGGLTHRACA